MTGTAKATREHTRYRIFSCVERAEGERSTYFSRATMYVPEKFDWVSRMYRGGYTLFYPNRNICYIKPICAAQPVLL